MSSVQPLRHAWRSLRRTPVFTLAAALTLVIGMAASVAIFAVLNGVLLKPLRYGNPESLVGMWHDMPGVGLSKTNQSSGTYYTYKKLVHSIENMGVSQEGAVNVAEPGGASEPQRITSAWITASLIPSVSFSSNVPSIRSISGPIITPSAARPAALISSSTRLPSNGTTTQVTGCDV